jgi:ribosomal-protein-alanine N-acetyltransferase
MDMRVATDRLELIAGTVKLARAEISDYALFSRLLDARVPDDWPPEENTNER